jgi:hypothetical protein
MELVKDKEEALEGKILIFSHEKKRKKGCSKKHIHQLDEAIEICNGANSDWHIDRPSKIPNELPISEEAAIKLQYKTRNH